MLSGLLFTTSTSVTVPHQHIQRFKLNGMLQKFLGIYKVLRGSKISNTVTERGILDYVSQGNGNSLHCVGSRPVSVLTRCSVLHLCKTQVQIGVKLGKQWRDLEQSITPRQESAPIVVSHFKEFRWAGNVARIGKP